MIDSMVLYNYSLPGESLEINNDIYPADNITTEVDVRYNERVRPTTHGIWIGNTFYGKRVWHIEGNILAQDSIDYNDRRRNLLRMLTPKSHLQPRQPMGYMKVWFTGFPDALTCDYTIEGYPEIPLEALSPARSRYQINLKCFDPRLYGKDHNQEAYPPTLASRTYNKTYNKSYTSPPGTGLDVAVRNYGDIEVYPIVYFYGPARDPEVIRHDEDGTSHSFKFAGLTLSATDVVRADFAKRTAQNIVTFGNVYNYKQGEWWTLEPGDNQVRTNSLDADSTSKTVFTWRDGYMM